MNSKDTKRSLVATPENVLGLITDTLASGEVLGTGNTATVYAFEDPALAGYALRVGKLPEAKTIIQGLTARTALTPPKNFLLEAHMGQALLVNNDRHLNPFLGIHQRIQGISLEQMRKQYPDSCERMKVFLTAVKAHGANPFYALFADAARVGFSHFAADPNIGNIMVDLQQGTLHLIDQLSFERSNKGDAGQALNDLHNVKIVASSGFFNPEPTDPKKLILYQGQCKEIQALMKTAYDDVAQMIRDNPKTLAFATTHSVEAIKMDAPRADVIKTLHQLNEQVNASVKSGRG